MPGQTTSSNSLCKQEAIEVVMLSSAARLTNQTGETDASIFSTCCSLSNDRRKRQCLIGICARGNKKAGLATR